MKIIKRYPNRKLYDTEASKYITLDDVASLIGSGVEFKIIDNKTKEDITSIILTQIIHEYEKRKRRLLPLEFLKKIIQYGGESVEELMEKFNIAEKIGLKDVEKKLKSFLGKKEEKIEEKKEKIKEIITGAGASVQEFEKKIDELLQETINKIPGIGLVVRELREIKREIQELKKRMSKIERKKKN